MDSLLAFLQSPAAIVLATLLYSLCSLPKVAGQLWAKGAKILAVIVFIASVVALFSMAEERLAQPPEQEGQTTQEKQVE